MDEVDELREMLVGAESARQVARERYGKALQIARREGWSNRKIGDVVGKSEAAIRLYMERNGL